jgi:hypothetical protein
MAWDTDVNNVLPPKSAKYILHVPVVVSAWSTWGFPEWYSLIDASPTSMEHLLAKLPRIVCVRKANPACLPRSRRLELRCNPHPTHHQAHLVQDHQAQDRLNLSRPPNDVWAGHPVPIGGTAWLSKQKNETHTL